MYPPRTAEKCYLSTNGREARRARRPTAVNRQPAVLSSRQGRQRSPIQFYSLSTSAPLQLTTFLAMKKAVRSFRVHVDRPVVKAGRMLSGRLTFSLRDAVVVKSITLIFEGHCKTSYSGTSVDDEGGGPPSYLFRVQVPMMPCLLEYEHEGKVKVPAGEHELPFGFPVPLASPSTFAGKHGYIFYCCRAKVILPVHSIATYSTPLWRSRSLCQLKVEFCRGFQISYVDCVR